MPAPRLLDLFCGAGGCSMGYSRAGFEVTGVDLAAQPNYPFRFVRGDALAYAEAHGAGYDVIAASPPCQAYSAMSRAVPAKAPRLIPQVRALLTKIGRPYVIENVEGAELIEPVLLCGTMLGVPVRRHRLFEVSPRLLVLTPPCSCRNGVVTGRLVGHRVAGKVAPGRRTPPPRTESDRRAALGCYWMTCREARQAIPPAYTEFLGRRLMAALFATNEVCNGSER